MRKTIKTIVLVLAIVSMNSFSSKAQAFEEGKNYIHFGYGFGNFIQAVFSIYDDYDEFSMGITGPVFAKYEYAISENVGVGLNFAYAGAKVSYKDLSYITTSGEAYEQKITWSSMSFLGRFNLHFGDSDVIDPYWGVGMGFRTASWKYEDNDPTYDNNVSAKSLFPLGFETTFGCRFMFSSAIGAYAEVGLAKAILQAGIALKL